MRIRVEKGFECVVIFRRRPDELEGLTLWELGGWRAQDAAAGVAGHFGEDGRPR